MGQVTSTNFRTNLSLPGITTAMCAGGQLGQVEGVHQDSG